MVSPRGFALALMRKDFTAAVMEAAVGDKSPSEKHQIKKADNVMSLPAFLIWCPQGDLNLLRCQISLQICCANFRLGISDRAAAAS